MQCDVVKKMMALYLDDGLSEKDKRLVQDHCVACSDCEAELNLFRQTWDLCGEPEVIEPRADFVSQFWTRLSSEQTIFDKYRFKMRNFLLFKKPAFSMVIGGVFVLLISIVSMQNLGWFEHEDVLIVQKEQDPIISGKIMQEVVVAKKGVQEVEWIPLDESIELVEDMEIIENLDFFENMEMLEQFDV